MKENETLFKRIKNIQFPMLAIGWYRIVTSLENSINNEPPQIIGPYFKRDNAIPVAQRMGARIHFPHYDVKFHIFKPKGAVKPDPIESMKAE